MPEGIFPDLFGFFMKYQLSVCLDSQPGFLLQFIHQLPAGPARISDKEADLVQADFPRPDKRNGSLKVASPINSINDFISA